MPCMPCACAGMQFRQCGVCVCFMRVRVCVHVKVWPCEYVCAPTSAITLARMRTSQEPWPM